MKAQAAKPTQKAARSERAPPLVSPLAMPMQPANEFILQRQSCACGGKCPRCLKKSIHTNVPIGPADDAFEREADSVAERVNRGRSVTAADPTRLFGVHGQKRRGRQMDSAPRGAAGA
jgi:hypothetical protein